MSGIINKDDVFYQDGYRLAEQLPQKFSKENLFVALKEMYHSVDLLIDSLLNMAQKNGMSVACHKGCEWCCHQAVYANSYELHFLSEVIKEKLPGHKERIVSQAKAKNDYVKDLTEHQVHQYKSPCPLLYKGSCIAYGARPMACRIYLSTKLESCLEFYKNPQNEANYPALLDFPLQAGKMMNEGFTAALREKNIETGEFRLEEGLMICLDTGFVGHHQF